MGIGEEEFVLACICLFINVYRILWAFNVTPSIDVTGAKNLPVTWNYTSRFNSCLVGFECMIASRGDKVAESLNMEYEGAKSRISDWHW